MTLLAPTLQAFFSDRLMGQRGASSHTIAAYRDSIRLLLRHAADRTHKQPCQLDIADLDAPLVASFLEYVERDRHNTVRTRNNRLAAIHSLFRYAALRHPEHAASIQRVLAIPSKRFERELVTSSPNKRQTHYSEPATPRRGLGGVTTRFSSSQSRVAFGSPNWPASRAAILCLLLERMCTASAKVGKSAEHHSSGRPSTSCACG